MNTYSSNKETHHLILIVGPYLLLHLTIRLLFSQTLQVDDAEQIRHAQNLLLGYPIPQPPLYSWLSWVLFQLFGTGLLTLTLLKYTLITLTFWATWLSSGYLFKHLQTRYLALFAFLLMPSFAWHMHQGFTHTILLGFAIAVSLHALLRLTQHQKPIDYLYLGAALGVGVMAKYSFLLFMVPLFISALSIKTVRQQLLQRRALFMVAAFLLVTTPHLYWLSQHYQAVFPAIDQKLKVSADNSIFEQFKSLGNFFVAALAFIVPWIFLFIHKPTKKQEAVGTELGAQLLNRFYLVLLLITLLLALFYTMPHFKVRWFHPFMMLFPLWWLTMIEGEKPFSQVRIRWVYSVTIIFTILIIAVRLVQVTIGPELGHYGRLNRPIMETLEKLPPMTKLTQPRNEVVKLLTNDDFLGAHLLSYYPENPIAIRGVWYRESGQNSKEEARCIQLWDSDDEHLLPPTDVEVEKITTQVAEVKYTLFWASLKKCP